jgi:uncharacterized protein (DUF1919 family)
MNFSNLWFYRINNQMRKTRNFFKRRNLKENRFSLISSNCNGCLMLHDLHLRYNSPFVNLCLKPSDFIKYIMNIDHYNQCELSFKKIDGKDYPVGVLDDITIYFMHYKSEEEATKKWKDRTNRIVYDNLFVMLTETKECSYEDLTNFDRIPIENKVVLTHKPYPEIKSSYYVRGFEDEGYCKILSDYIAGQFLGKRYYDDFDYVKWFNSSVL